MNPLIVNIGRHSDNNIVIPGAHVSSHHAQLLRDEDGQWFIHDLRSSNGTFLNGVRIEAPAMLHKGDQVSLGNIPFQWQDVIPQYEVPAAPAKNSNRTLYYLLAGLAIAVAVFLVFLWLNENAADKPVEKKIVPVAPGRTPGQPSQNNHAGGEETGVPLPKENNKPVNYDISCFTGTTDKTANEIGNTFDSLRSNYINTSGVSVSLREEIDFGNTNHKALMQGRRTINNPFSEKLESILQQLAGKIPEPRGFTYHLFLIESNEINAWTSGGRIYFTTAMLKFTDNDDEIAAIIGHEIFHNELGHINKMLRAQKLAVEKFGPKAGDLAATIDAMLRAPFGKKDEAMCDLKGAELIMAAGFDPCRVIKLWGRMAAAEGKSDPIDSFLRSHPYASKRKECIGNHLAINYNIRCNE